MIPIIQAESKPVVATEAELKPSGVHSPEMQGLLEKRSLNFEVGD